MPVEQTIYFSGQDQAVRRFLEFLAPTVQARLAPEVEASEFLSDGLSQPPDCLVIETDSRNGSSRDALLTMNLRGACLPVIAVGDEQNTSNKERWLRAGAVAFVPIEDSRLLRSAVTAGLGLSQAHDRLRTRMEDFRRRLNGLSPKQRRVLNALIRGGSNKQIAVDHGVSERTLERRRAELIEELNVRSVIEAAWWYGRSDVPEPGQPFHWPALNLRSASSQEEDLSEDEDSAVIALAESQSAS